MTSAPQPNWKNVFRAGMYACPKLRQHKMHRDLLGYLVHSANQSSRFCWSSQSELAKICGCSVRNIHDLIAYLAEMGALFPAKFVDLPKTRQERIRALSPRKNFRNCKVYYLSVDWAKDMLAAEAQADAPSGEAASNLSKAAQGRGRARGNERRRRYAPMDVLVSSEIPALGDFDEWQILTATAVKTGSPTSAFKPAETGSGATDILIEYNPAEISTPNNGADVSSTLHPQEQITGTAIPFSPTVPDRIPVPDGYGAGEAGAPGQGATLLAGLGGAHETLEYDAARARESERRAS
ncbi:helix-turn-helix domain-containing protein [Rhizobium sp. YJ-22]|uniref:helix-turn-helix domain-containing protein n=1 Tax=Rhizobium sp. YJ-22 TaxID=3037556 RepID=UPI0024124384|nr:helix-turn-helix domain-containing protein [Rhizobium sp. YJ-22]MDG3577149.1 helix-turn-helix domain-containing protein [Rhizobium sp. YJ-22]